MLGDRKGLDSQWPRVILASFISLAVVSCSAPAPVASPASQSKDAPAANAPAAAAAPQRGGVFALSVRTAPTTVHPFGDTGLGNTITLSGVYDPLVIYDYTGDFRDQYKLEGALAERWERTDPTTYIFYLRKGVKFHDGSEMTADDVVWTFEYMRNPANNFRRATLLRQAEQITAVDPHTVKITTKSASPTFLDDLERNAIVMSKKAFDRGVDFEKEAVGTGPYKLQSWDPRGGAILVRNEEYWGAGKPYLDRVKLNYNMDPSAMVAAFASGQNDVVKVSDKPQFDAIKLSNPNGVGESFPQDISDHLIFNVTRPPLDDIRVRRAVHLALNRQEMQSTLTFGLGTINPPGINGARKGGWSIPLEELEKLPGYRQPKDADIVEAKRLLAEAGFPNGLKLTLTYNAGFTRYPGEAEMVAGQLKQAGIDMVLDPKEEAVARKAEQDGSYELTFSQYYMKPENDWAYWLHTKGRPNTKGANDPELDRMIDQQNTELDVEKRKGEWIAIQRYLLDKLYTVPLVTQVGFVVYQPYVHGWGDNRAGQAVNMTWADTWLEPSKVPAGR
jgi:peptide/nickel transport system substrate-binding protein